MAFLFLSFRAEGHFVNTYGTFIVFVASEKWDLTVRGRTVYRSRIIVRGIGSGISHIVRLFFSDFKIVILDSTLVILRSKFKDIHTSCQVIDPDL